MGTTKDAKRRGGQMPLPFVAFEEIRAFVLQTGFFLGKLRTALVGWVIVTGTESRKRERKERRVG